MEVEVLITAAQVLIRINVEVPVRMEVEILIRKEVGLPGILTRMEVEVRAILGDAIQLQDGSGQV